MQQVFDLPVSLAGLVAFDQDGNDDSTSRPILAEDLKKVVLLSTWNEW